MSGDWIKIEHWTQDKPEVFVMADALGIDPDAVLGKLVRVWVWADQQTFDGNAVSVTFSLLDRVSGQKGFADALLQSGWLKRVADGVQFVNFDRHNGETAKTRALTAKRVKKHRAGNGTVTPKPEACNASSVTLALPEKRREEKNLESVFERPRAESHKPTESQKPPETTGGISEVIIPNKVNTPECRDAAAKWFQYLAEKGADYKRPDLSATALEAWWREMARIGPKEMPLAVERSMAGGHLTVKVLPDPKEHYKGPAKAAKPDANDDWLHTLNICRKYSSATQADTLARKDELTAQQLAAVKEVGLHRISSCDSFDYKQVFEMFMHAMKKVAQ
jgi:hypothetical protein